MPKAKPGDVWLVDLGFAAKTRPCLMLSDEPFGVRRLDSAFPFFSAAGRIPRGGCARKNEIQNAKAESSLRTPN